MSVLAPIELNNYSWVIAGKIDDEVVDRGLSPKAKSESSQFAQMKPELEFLAGHALAELARQLVSHAADYTIPPPGAPHLSNGEGVASGSARRPPHEGEVGPTPYERLRMGDGAALNLHAL
jgi:hypothetical protein